MQRKALFRCAALSLSLCALFLNGCSEDENATVPTANPTAITTASPSGNVQAKIFGVSANRSPVVTFALSDEAGLPLDPNVVVQDTNNRVRFFIARLDASGNYTNYILDASGLPTFDGSSSKNGIVSVNNPKGSFNTVSPGVYTYTFGADIRSSALFDASKTHTVGIQILRNVTKNGKPFQQISNPYFNFRPDGVAVTATREVVSISACNQCHGKLGVHGGSRIEIALCILCHNAGANPLSTGQSIDFKQMIHKIHVSSHLPSKGYFTSATFANFSTVTYPVFSSDSLANGVPMDCVKCHQAGQDTFGNSYGKNVNNWKTNPTIAACSSCHNTTSFDGSTTATVDGLAGVTLTAHAGGTPVANGSCTGCHPSTGSDYGNSVPGIHAVWEKSSVNQGIVGKVLSATNVIAGKYPRVTFQVTDAAGNPIAIDPGTLTNNFTGTNKTMVFKNNIQVYFLVKPKNGPDFLNTKPLSDPAYFSANVQGLGTNNSGGQVQVNQTLNAGNLGTVDAVKGIYFVNFSTAARTIVTAGVLSTPQVPTPMPRLAGDYANGATVAFALQATRSDIPIVRSIGGVPTTTVLGAGATVSPDTILNPVTPAFEQATAYYDLQTGAVVLDTTQQRRKVVDNAKCIACHNIIVGSPGNNGVPGLHGGGRPNAEACVLCHGPNKNESDFKFLIHRWHTGKDSAGAQTNGAQANSRWLASYKGVTYPNDRRRCNACHIDDNPQLPSTASFPTRQDKTVTVPPGGPTNIDPFAFAAGFSSTSTVIAPTPPDPSLTTMPGTNRMPPTTATCIACHDGQTGNVVGSNGGPTGHATANYAGAPFFIEQCSTCHNDSFRALGHQLPN